MTTELSAVGEVINRLHQEICESAHSSYSKAMQIGELLSGQKQKVKHGEWLDWLSFNCPSISERTASRYMGIYRDQTDIKTAKLTDTSFVYQILTEVFTIEEEEDPDKDPDDDEDPDDEDDPDKETSARGGSSEEHVTQGKSGAVSSKTAEDNGRPSPQDVIRAANQMEMAEKCISAGMKPFLEVSEALLLIKQNRLYEIAQFRSFEEYCSDRWGFNYRLTKRNSG